MDKDTYRNKLVKEYHVIIDNFRATRRVIMDREAHQPTIQKQIAAAKREADAKLKVLIDGLNDTVSDAEKVGVAEMLKARRANAEDPKREGYVHINAQNAFDGLTDEQIIEKYPDYVKSLHPDDKPYQYAVDDLVRAKIRGKGNVEMLNHVIELHMPAHEKVAQAGIGQAKALRDTHGTIAGLIQNSLDRINEGGERVNLDVAETFDGLVEGHGKYKPAVELPDIKIHSED